MFVLNKNNIMGHTLCLNIVKQALFYMLCFNDVQCMNYSYCVVAVLYTDTCSMNLNKLRPYTSPKTEASTSFSLLG